jgi:choloylglycine hydrolase
MADYVPERKDPMCTVITYKGANNYFGRNLDLEYHYKETVTITPREYRFPFEKKPGLSIIGIATVAENYPLYYDAMNEAGLAMAGLNFTQSAYYPPADNSKKCIAPHEFIPWVLRQFTSVSKAIVQIRKIKICDISFSGFKQAKLHWILCDKEQCVTIEQTKNGLQLYHNPVGVLTNEPPFSYQMTNLANYMYLSAEQPENKLCPTADLPLFSRGMGALGLPGDLSSASRFVRAAFTKQNAAVHAQETASVTQCFHILDTVKQTEGCVDVAGKPEKTVYTSCCSMDNGIYYYTTYENSQITAVHLYHEDLNSNQLIAYPLSFCQHIRTEN